MSSKGMGWRNKKRLESDELKIRPLLPKEASLKPTDVNIEWAQLTSLKAKGRSSDSIHILQFSRRKRGI